MDIFNMQNWSFNLYALPYLIMGVLEARNDRNERYGLDRLKQAFLAHSRKKPGEMIRVIREDLHAFINGQPLYDDITLVSLENE